MAEGACPDCGGRIGSDDATCPHCGADLRDWAEDASAVQETEEQELPAETRREERLRRL